MLHPWTANQEPNPSELDPIEPDGNEGSIVFRLRRNHKGLGLFIGFCVGLYGSTFLVGPAGFVAVLAIAAAGWIIGNIITYEVCSDRKCRARLTPDATYCPGCNGKIEGVIYNASEHDAAVGNLRRSRHAAEDEAGEPARPKPAPEAKRIPAASRASTPKSSPRPVLAARPIAPVRLLLWAVPCAAAFAGAVAYLMQSKPTAAPDLQSTLLEPTREKGGPVTFEGVAAPYRITTAKASGWRRAPEADLKETQKQSAVLDLWLVRPAKGADIYVSVEFAGQPMTANEAAQRVVEALRTERPNFTEISRALIEDRRDGGVLLRARFDEPGGEVGVLTGIFVADDTIYRVEAIASSKMLSLMNAELSAIIRSFEAKPDPVASMPEAPLTLDPPPAPPPSRRGADLRKQPAEELYRESRVAASEKDYEGAAQLAHWAIAAGLRAHYNLACYYSRLNKVDAALYWLQSAAANEGVDPAWAAFDADLATVRADPRWAKVEPYMRRVARHWMHRGEKKTLVTLPRGYKAGRAIPVVVSLHGFGASPDEFTGPYFQQVATALSVAFVSVSGTVPVGPHTYKWAEFLDRDRARVEDALTELSSRLTVAEGKIVLMGFSQGAQIAAELAARHPTRYAGAIAMSPGTTTKLSLNDVPSSDELRNRRFVVVTGGGEGPSTLATTASDAKKLAALGADVFHKEYPGVSEHALPLDFSAAFPAWVRFILGSGPKP
jgi:predicted esterase